MLSYIINMTFAISLATGSYWIKWWLPLILFPSSILLFPSKSISNAMYSAGLVVLMRWVFYVIATIYVIVQTILFKKHIESWYGWLIGLIISWILAGVVAGKLEPYLRHRRF